MKKSNEYTTVAKELAKLKPNETIVIVRQEGTGYFIGVADNVTAQNMAVTMQELAQIVRLGARHLGLEVVEK